MKSLKASMASAESEAPSTGGGGAWDADAALPVEIVATNPNTNLSPKRIGLQIQRTDDGRRRFFDLYFDEDKAAAYAQTARKIRALGLDPVIDSLDAQFPDDVDSQLQGLAAAMIGTQFVAKIQKVDSTKTPGRFINYFDVVELTYSPNTPSEDGLGGGFSGGLLG